MKKIKKKYIIFILILFISIGFAYLSTTLNIAGLIGYKGNKWSVYFDNIQMITNDVSGEKPVINNSKDSIDFNITFNEPGETYKFSVDIVNDGTIDAMLNELIKTGINSSNEEYLDYSVTYYDGDQLAVNDLLKHGTKVRVIVNVEYKYTTEVLATVGSNNYSLTLKYIQANDNANPVDNYYESDKSNAFVLNNAKANTLSNLKIYGKNEQTQYQGYNLLDVPSELTFTQFKKVYFKNKLSAGTYTLKFDSRESTSELSFIVIGYNYDSSDSNALNYYATRNVSDSGFTFTLTEEQASNANVIYLYSSTGYVQGAGVSVTYKNLMIYNGADTKDYEPYVGGTPSPSYDYPQEVKSVSEEFNIEINNKNLLAINNIDDAVHDGITAHYNDDGTITLNGKITKAHRLHLTTYPIKFKKGKTYTIYGEVVDGTATPYTPGANWSVLFYGNSSNLTFTNTKTVFSKNYTPEEDVDFVPYLWFGMNNNSNEESGILTNYTLKLQIEESSSFTSFAKGIRNYSQLSLGNLKLNGIDDYRDYIFNKDGEWYVHRAIRKFKLENNFLDYKYGNHYYSESIADYITSNNAPLCTHFRGVVTVGDLSSFVPTYKNSGYDLIGFNDTHAFKRIYIKSLLTSEELNNYISSNDIYLYYKLEPNNSYDEKITDTNLINQLNNLISNNLVDGTNYITVSSDGVVPDIEFDYVHE